MGEIWRFTKAEYRKMKGTYLPLIFAGVPLLGCGLFLLYYSFSPWDTESEIMAYAEAMGAALPFLISLLSALSVGLEEKNHFQTFLGTARKKKSALLGKYIALLLCTFFSFLLAVGIFGAGFTFLLGKEGMTPGLCVKLIFALWLPSAAFLFFPSCRGDVRGRSYLSSGKRGKDAWTLCEAYCCTVASFHCLVRNSSFS